MRIPTLVIFATAMLTASPALSHALLQEANPPVGGVVSASPSEIRLKFSESVEPRFSTISLMTKAGKPVALGKPETAPGDQSVLDAKVQKTLGPGAYIVIWHAVSVDTHRTQGNFHFTIGR